MRPRCARMRFAALVSPASSCMAAPVRICEIESWMSAARRVRSAVLSSASALAERSWKSSRPRFSESFLSSRFQKRIAAMTRTRTATTTDRRVRFHHGGRASISTSSGRSTTRRIPFSVVPVESDAQFSVARTHVPATRTLQPGTIASQVLKVARGLCVSPQVVV